MVDVLLLELDELELELIVELLWLLELEVESLVLLELLPLLWLELELVLALLMLVDELLEVIPLASNSTTPCILVIGVEI